MMQFIGCHLTISKGYTAMGRQALKLGGNTAQFFTRNPRGGRAKELDPEDIAGLQALMAENHFGPLIAHAPYTINPCAANEKTLEFALMTMADDLRRLEFLPEAYYNFHPGSHVGQGIETGIEKIAATLNQVMYPEQKTTVLLETMAGKGSEVGSRFEELREIIDRTQLQDKIGVCLDTCHVADGGYDIVNDLDGVLTEFDKVIGLDRLKALHLNDSMNPIGSHKDRHQKLGQGTLGLDTFRRIMEHPALKELPKVLETPNELPGYEAEIQLLREYE
jgi:deoxyribonuclease-4